MSSRIRRAAAWLAPSVALAALTTTIAAVNESAAVNGDAISVAAMAGFTIAVAWPVAFALALSVRIVLVTWRPGRLLASLSDESGGAPRLLGWSVGLVGGGALLLHGTNQLVWFFAWFTAFKPHTMAILMPVAILLLVIVVILVARVAAEGVGWMASRVESHWLRRRGGSLFTPRRIVGASLVCITVSVGLAWYGWLGPKFEHVQMGELHLLGVVLAGLGVGHLCWHRADTGRYRTARSTAAIFSIAVATGLIGLAVWARGARPSTVLELWGEGGVGANAIAFLYDLDRVRDDIPRSAMALRARAGAGHPDVVLVTIDTFRPDRLQAYGGPVHTPALTELARRGTVFDWAFAPSNVTRRSLPAIVTGLTPTRIRGQVHGWALKMDPRHITIAERMRASGYRTLGLFCCEGFWGPQRRLGLERGIDDLVIERDGAALVAAYRDRMRTRGQDASPTFTWIHFIELHNWASGNPEPRPEQRRRYDALLTQVDGFVGELIAATAALPAERQPIMVVTGDHSEALGDHGQPFHSSDLYNSQIHVPLLVAGPGVVSRRVAEAVTLVDLAPTLIDLSGFVPPQAQTMDGRSLADLLSGARVPDIASGHAYSAMIVDRFIRDRRAAIVHGTWKLIEQHGRFELYDLAKDPAEKHDIAGREPERLREMIARLHEQQLHDRISPFR